MKLFICIVLFFVHANLCASETLEKLTQHKWHAGAENCTDIKYQPIEIYPLNNTTYILRQNKCLHYEAPFIYLILGSQRALLLDTGATKEPELFPIRARVLEILKQYYQDKTPELWVVHSHGHPDHYAADEQFKNLAGVKVVGIGTKAITSFYQFDSAELRTTSIDLGARVLKIMHTPGHEVDGISIYDPQLKLLLSGDLIYPGRLLVSSWIDFKQSISRLARFSKTHAIDAILGGHIELSAGNKVYPYGLSYHPTETSLVLLSADLQQLHHALENTSDKATEFSLGKFHVIPLK